MKMAPVRLAVLALFMGAGSLLAHLEKPVEVFEGLAGPYRVRIIIRTAGVIPGRAEITVRALTEGVDRVTVLPVHWRTGLSGAPSADVAKPVPGNARLFASELWLMTGGSYSVHVTVSGSRGAGEVIVPVNSVATKRLAMTRGYGMTLAALGLLLVFLFVAIHGAALREAVVEPGRPLSRGRVWLGRAVMVIALGVVTLGLRGGKQWWDSVDRDYRNNRLFKPVEIDSSVREESGQRILRLECQSSDRRARLGDLVPDHGKLMHLFLIREPELDAFAHLHPVQQSDNVFDCVLSPLPAGSYRLYSDVTQETGFSQTMTGVVEIPDLNDRSTSSVAAARERSWEADDSERAHVRQLVADPDDSWMVEALGQPDLMTQPLRDGRTISFEADGPLVANRDVSLKFTVRDASGDNAPLRPYLGMFSHAVVRNRSGTVFNHLHPVGTISLASQQVMQLRAQGKTPDIITAQTLEPFCQDPPAEEGRRPLQFPTFFSEPGAYRLWVQVKAGEIVETAVFDFSVAAGLD